MNLPINDKVYLEEITHTWIRKSDGKYLLGATGLMAKHGLSTDYSDIPKHVLDNAAERGTLVHTAIENDFRGGQLLDIIDVTSPHYPFVKNALEQFKKLELPILEMEYVVSDNEIAATKIDLVMDAVCGLTLGDIKTSHQLYIEPLRWQLAIGCYLFEQQTGLEVPFFRGVHIREKAEVTAITPIPREEVEKLFECERNGTRYDPPQNKGELELINSDDLHNALVIERKIVEMEESVKILKAERAKFVSGMYNLMEQHDIKQIDNEAYRITRVLPTTRKSFDSARFKKDNPELYEDYVKESPVKGSLRITLKN